MPWLEDCIRLHGGQDDLFAQLIDVFQARSWGGQLVLQGDGPNCLAVLLEGHSGTGKGHFARTLAECSGVPWKSMDLVQYVTDETSAGLKRFRDALGAGGCMVILENADLVMVPSSSPGQRSFRAVLEEAIISGQKGLFRLIIGITSAGHLIHDRTLFNQCIRLTISTPAQRLAILRIIAGSLVANGHLGEEDLHQIARLTHGYSVADLEGLKTQAASVALAKGEAQVRFDLQAFTEALGACRPSLMAQYYRPAPRQRLEDLVGVDDIIERLHDLVLLPFRAEEACRRFQVRLPKGILLHGPTGTGKTHLALGLVAAAGLNFIQVEATAIRSKYVGEAEKRLAELFQRARDAAPAILLIDQLEGLVSRRQAEGGSGDRLVTCFLTEMDGIGAKGGQQSGVLVIGITSSPDKLDPAMVRPGRLGIHLGLPSSLPRDARRLLLTSRAKVRLSLEPEEIEAILDATAGFTGARFDSLLRQCAMEAVDEGVVTFQYFRQELNLAHTHG